MYTGENRPLKEKAFLDRSFGTIIEKARVFKEESRNILIIFLFKRAG
jgi:hypothetical protein